MGDASRPRVGFIGLGRMGAPMCRNLLAAGVPLTVHNRSPGRAEMLARDGATVATSVGELAASNDVIIACLDTVAASDMVFLSTDGVVVHARPGSLLIDHGTISPTLAERIAREAQGRGLAFLDAPVSGGPEGAADGTLAIMVGGESSAYHRALPVLEAYGRTIRHMGAAGSGTRAKLVNQLLTFAHGAAAAEAIAIAEHVELDLDALAEVLRAGFGQSRMLDRTVGRVQAGNYDAGAALRLYDKDLALLARMGERTELQLPVVGAVREILRAAMTEGIGDRDIAALRLRYETETGGGSD